MNPLRVSHYLNSVTLKRDEVRDFESYPFCIPAVRHLETLEFHPKVTFFVGENGSGKSTLLEGIAERLGYSIEGGTKNTNLTMGEYRSPLTTSLMLTKTYNRPMDGFFLRAESYYNFASMLDGIEGQPFCGGLLASYGGKSLHEQSHGESFFATMLHRIGGHGVYLFDEPEAALSPQRQMSLLVRLHDLIDDFSQFIIATHSPIILAYPDAWIYQFSERGVERVNYEDTESFQVTRNFLRDPKGMMRKLLRRDDELDLSDR